MFDRAKTRRKAVVISCIAIVMAGLLYVYDLNAAPVERVVHALTSALSPLRAFKERALAAEFERSGSASASDEIGPWDGVPAFVYHGIVKKPDRFNMTEKTFKDQMFALKRAGYRTVTLRDFQAFMRGEKDLPPKSFLLTFDDGRTDSYEGADPILKTLGFTAVMFVASGASMPSEDVRWSYYISRNDILDMLKSGRWEIGSHAVQAHGGYVSIDADGKKANFLSGRKWFADRKRLETEAEHAARVAWELGESKRVMEEAFQAPIDAFSFPFGDYGQQSKNHDGAEETIGRLVRETYAFAFRQVWPNDGEFAFNHARTRFDRLKRIETPTDWSGERLVAFLETARDKPLPYGDEFRHETGWQGTWGDVSREDGGLRVAASASSTGSAAFLDGTRAWKDYSYVVTYDRRKGSHVSLLARYDDPRNHLVCTFGDDRVKIERMVDGVPVRLAESATQTPPADVGAVVGMRVRGAAIECLVGASPVVSATDTEGSGGIGVRVWDQEPGGAEILVRRIFAAPL